MDVGAGLEHLGIDPGVIGVRAAIRDGSLPAFVAAYRAGEVVLPPH